MKRLWVLLALGFSLLAFAQTPKPFAGASLNFQWINGIGLTGLLLQGGAYDLLGDAALRGSIGLGLTPTNYFELGVDVLVPLSTDRLTPYAGGGLGYVNFSGTSFVGLRGIVGADYTASKDISLFGEAVPILYLVNGGTAFGIQLRFGVNKLF
ncbi:MAG: hypothetical protein IVW51_09335 [Thermaceae bacterium]|nr:hypothetical protein [Thermaceae bacterium]